MDKEFRIIAGIILETFIIGMFILCCEIKYNEVYDYELREQFVLELQRQRSQNEIEVSTNETVKPANTYNPSRSDEPDISNNPVKTDKPVMTEKAKRTIKPLETNKPINTKQPDKTIHPTKKPSSDDEDEVTLVAVGDFLAHMPVINSGKNADGTYNYDHVFSHLKDDFASADIAVINMETVMGGKNLGYSTFPRFNSPQEIGDAMVVAGFDVILHATNHTVDKGDSAVVSTLNFWSKYKNQVTVLGIHESAENAAKINVIEKNNIKIAMLNYTYGLNGLSMDSDKTWRVDMLSDKEKIADDISRAKQMADVVIVYPHWGTEYSLTTTSQQEKWTDFFIDNDVDVVIGSHPHVLEPVEWVEKEVNGEKSRMLVYYSLGNFVSYQLETARMLGGMASLTITKDKDGIISIEDEAITPIVTHFASPTNKENMTVYKLSEYTQELASIHNVNKHQTQGQLTLDSLKSIAREVLGKWYK